MVGNFVVSFVGGVDIINSRPVFALGFGLRGGTAIGLLLNIPQTRDLRDTTARLLNEPHFAGANNVGLEGRRQEIHRAQEELNAREPDRFLEVATMRVSVRQEGAVLSVVGPAGDAAELTLDLSLILELHKATQDALPLMEGKHHGSNSLH